MALNKQKKSEIIQDLEKKIKEANFIVFLNFHGLKVKDSQVLRQELKKENLGYKVAKKTLIKLAFKNLGRDIENFDLKGEVGLSFAQIKEITTLPKILYGFKKNHPKIEILGGVFENQYLDDSRLEEIARLPSQEILYTNLVGQLAMPLRGFVYALNGPMSNFGRIIYQLSQNK